MVEIIYPMMIRIMTVKLTDKMMIKDRRAA